MSAHKSTESSSAQPVGVVEIVRVLVMFAVGAGWITAQDANTLTVGGARSVCSSPWC